MESLSCNHIALSGASAPECPEVGCITSTSSSEKRVFGQNELLLDGGLNKVNGGPKNFFRYILMFGYGVKLLDCGSQLGSQASNGLIQDSFVNIVSRNLNVNNYL